MSDSKPKSARPCARCFGTGWIKLENNPCPQCKGSGKIPERPPADARGYVAALETALTFYADSKNYERPHEHTVHCGHGCPRDDSPPIILDAGRQARLALGGPDV